MQAVLSDLTNPQSLFGHLAYIFIIASMMMNNLQNLRILAVLSGISAMIHFFLVTGDRVSFAWEAIFTITTAVQLSLLYYRSRAVQLSHEESALVEEALGLTNPAEQRKLLGHVDWKNVKVGEILMEQGNPVPPLLFVASGAAAIEADGKLVGVCGNGDFLGEMSLISGGTASATVRATNPMVVGRFDRAKIAELLDQSDTVHRVMTDAFNRGLSSRVLKMNEAAT